MKLDPETLTLADITFDSDMRGGENDDTEIGNIVRSIPSLDAALNGGGIDDL